MAARLDTVAKYICEAGDWQVSNLKLQKVLYMAQMYYMGQNDGERLFDAGFEAWEFGPVVPDLYRRVRMFGAGPIKDVFYNARYFRSDDRRVNFLNEVCSELLPQRPGALVDITHWPEGAWAQNYVEGIRNIRIPDEHIFAEFGKRIRARRSKKNSSVN